jgi:hypothetical protein
MLREDKQSFDDITIVKIGKSSGNTPPKSSSNRFLHNVIAILGALVVLGIAYAAGVRAGYFLAPQYLCCNGILELNFDFELQGAKR